MPDSMLDVRGQQYGRIIMHLAQQKESKLMPYVYVKPENIEGKTFFQDRMGQWSMSTKAAPNADTPENDPNLSRRMGIIKTEHDARLIDRSLGLQVLSDPKSQTAIAGGASMGRAMDDEIISAAFGSANYGETGSSTVALPAGQQIAAGAAGLTLPKVLQTKRLFDDNDIEMEDRVFVVSPQGLEDLLNIEQATSSDYAAIKALVRGEIDTWMGFKWILSTRLPISGTTRSCLAFQKYGLCYGSTESPFVRVGERSDKSYSHQVYYELNHGCVRLEEERVVQVDITES